jgi:indolepyruvate ferredoxin oxidoreductase
LRPYNLNLAVRMAEVVQQVRGFGPVKLANLVTARAQWQALLDAWHGRSPEPVPAKTPQARRVIPVRAG